MASRPAKSDFRKTIQSEPGQRDMASRPSKPDFWCEFQSEAGQSTMACSSSKPDLCRALSIFARLRCVARGIGSLGDWGDVVEMLNLKKNGGFGEGEGRKEGWRVWVGETLLQALLKLQGERTLRKSSRVRTNLDNSSTNHDFFVGSSNYTPENMVHLKNHPSLKWKIIF